MGLCADSSVSSCVCVVVYCSVRGGLGSEGAFSFLWGSERSGFMHLYLYTYIPGKS